MKIQPKRRTIAVKGNDNVYKYFLSQRRLFLRVLSWFKSVTGVPLYVKIVFTRDSCKFLSFFSFDLKKKNSFLIYFNLSAIERHKLRSHPQMKKVLFLALVHEVAHCIDFVLNKNEFVKLWRCYHQKRVKSLGEYYSRPLEMMAISRTIDFLRYIGFSDNKAFNLIERHIGVPKCVLSSL